MNTDYSNYTSPELCPAPHKSWNCRTFALIDKIIYALYDAIIRFATLCISPWNPKHQVSNLTEHSPLETAEAKYQQELRALQYLQASLLLGTIYIFKNTLTLMAQAKYNVELNVEGKKVSSQEKLNEIIADLNEKETFLKEEDPSQDIHQITPQIFKLIKELEPILKEIQTALPKKSTERKNFIRFRKTLAEQNNKQIHVHKTPSINLQYNNFQAKVREAWIKLEALKTAQAVAPIQAASTETIM